MPRPTQSLWRWKIGRVHIGQNQSGYYTERCGISPSWADAPPEVVMSNEEIATELLSVLMEKMWFREGLPSEGWAVETICNALVAAQQSVQSDVALCPVCQEPRPVVVMCPPN